jgi:transposase InsO family protein
VRFRWIDEHRQSLKQTFKAGLSLVCWTLDVTRQGYLQWKKRSAAEPGKRATRKAEVVKKIQQAHADSRQTYGSPRVHRELKAQDMTINEKTVAKYMKDAGLRADPPKPFRPQTTDSDHAQPIADNKLDRQFERSAPDEGYVADITYIPTSQGFLFLAVVIDLFSRRVVGHAMADHLKSPLAIDALTQALRQRRPAKGSWPQQETLFHSDRGVQYASAAFRTVLEAHGIDRSMSRTGNCYDNAVAESFFATLKRELVNRHDFATHEEARQAIFEYIEVFYNRQRRHSTLGYLSPEQFEANYAARAA